MSKLFTERKWRYNLDLPQELDVQINERCEARGMNKAAFIRRMIKLGLILDEVQTTPGQSIIIREPGQPDTRIIFA